MTIRELTALARSHGWDVQQRRGGHLAFLPPTGPPVIAPATPSDWRASHNLAADLRRHGLPVPHRGGHQPRNAEAE